MSDNPKCETCRFWNTNEQLQYDGAECRRHAPIITLGRSKDSYPLGTWPRTHSSAWCGDHEMIIEECKHEVRNGDWCDPCNKSYKDAQAASAQSE